MDRKLVGLLVWLGIVTADPTVCVAGSRDEAPGKTIAEYWECAYLQGARSGYVHTMIREVEPEGVKLVQGTIALRLTVKRFSEVIQLAMDSGTVETPDGRVVGTSRWTAPSRSSRRRGMNSSSASSGSGPCIATKTSSRAMS
jgi:hypothetical protein